MLAFSHQEQFRGNPRTPEQTSGQQPIHPSLGGLNEGSGQAQPANAVEEDAFFYQRLTMGLQRRPLGVEEQKV